MDKNAALAMFLIFGLWMIYFLFLSPKPTQVTQPAQQSATQQERQTPESPAQDSREQERILPTVTDEQLVRADSEQIPVDTVVVSSDLYELRFITRGGVLTSALLKQYPAFKPGDKKLSDSDGPVQLIPSDESQFLYTRLFLKNMEKPIELGARNFTANRKKLTLGPDKPDGTVEFLHTLRGNQTIKIVYTFSNDSYLIGAKLYLPGALHGARENEVEILLGPTLVSNEKNPKDDYGDYGIAYYENGEVIRKNLKDLSKSDWSPSGNHSILWGGVKSKYFISSFFVPDAPMSRMNASGNQDNIELEFSGIFSVPAETGEPVDFSLYVGPQAYQELTKLNYGLPKLLQYGWAIIRPFCKIVLTVLLWMHKWINSYSLILILFAVIVKVVFYPLTIKSTKSQIKMQQIQPLINQIREQYKDEPQKLQQEMLRIYKEEKVNPLGGCLPIVVQMPVLFALFWVFRLTIEFRGAEGFGWIHDLSQPDPFYILPVVMGATTFLQQKMTPTPTDPKMAPMMYMMPVLMVIIFINFSSGLVFYYTFFNIIQILQQLYINKRYHAPAKAVAGVSGKAHKAVADGGVKKNRIAGGKKK